MFFMIVFFVSFFDIHRFMASLNSRILSDIYLKTIVSGVIFLYQEKRYILKRFSFIKKEGYGILKPGFIAYFRCLCRK